VSVDSEKVKEELENLDFTFEDVLFIKKKFESSLLSEDSIYLDDWFERLDSQVFFLKNNATRWLREIEYDR
jgi:hypothetical protein